MQPATCFPRSIMEVGRQIKSFAMVLKVQSFLVLFNDNK